MRLTVVLLALTLAACSTQTADPSYYLIRPQQELPSGKLKPSTDFTLGNVAIASYLDQPGILLETADGKIHAAKQNLWAEPVYEGVRNVLFAEIARSTGEELLPTKLDKDTTVVNIRIDELHGTHDGKAKLAAYWWLTKNGKVLSAHRFSQTNTLAADGYSALVRSEEALLTELAQNIASSLISTAPD